MDAFECSQPSFIMDTAPRIPARGGITKIRHFNGVTRRTSDWDGLRKDEQLWFEGADCLVYFYNQRASQRGASLKLPFEAIQLLNCTYLTEQCTRTRRRSSSDEEEPSTFDRRYHRLSPSDPDAGKAKHEMYIPAPSGISKEQAFSYHLTTRNLLAYAVGSPLVGEKLSTALVDLWRRIQDWKIPVRPSDFTEYLERRGYLDFTENAEHAIACLKLAEDAGFRDMWIDSFVHCVGMHERLYLSPEFPGISKTTMALITRASLEMDLHIARVTRAIGSFLEDELGPEHLGLSKAGRDHLDHFRSFLHAFYVSRLGYFPPKASSPWNKRPWVAMHHDLENLYDFLADTQSSPDWASNLGLSGGFCVVQNVQSFDLRHGYPPLPHPLPLLPMLTAKSKASAITLRAVKLGKKASFSQLKMTPRQALAAATNPFMEQCPLVQEYQTFERQQQKTEGKLDISEARKIRWLLIYGVLQMLNSITRAPAEVRDTETASYPLCVLTAGCPPFQNTESRPQTATTITKQSSNDKMLVPQALDDLEGRSTTPMSIHPDCEADSAEDYFASMNMSRSESTTSLAAINSPLKRTASIRMSMHSSVQALSKSMVGSISRRNSSRRASIALVDLNRSTSLCEMVSETYDNNSTDTLLDESCVYSQATLPPGNTTTTDILSGFDFGFTAADHDEPEPVLEDVQLELRPQRTASDRSAALASESDFSGTSDESNPSNRSSYVADGADSPVSDLSSWDGGSRRPSSASITSLMMRSDSLSPTKQHQVTYQPSNPSLRTITGHPVNGGTYIPKGMISVSTEILPPAVEENVESARTASSCSMYGDYAVQAGDIEEVERFSGRRRKGGRLSRLSDYGIVLEENNVW